MLFLPSHFFSVSTGVPMSLEKRQWDVSMQKKEELLAVAVIRSMSSKWESNFVSRDSIGKFTGGLYTAGYLANEDSRGAGVQGAFRVGRKICYPVDSLCDWLISRLEVKS